MIVVLKGLHFFLQTRTNINIVGEAQNGEEALKLVEKCQPDVVLMDVLMPDMNGIEATKRIKENLPHIKVIILTSSSDKDHVIPAIRAGGGGESGYQLKDVDPELLEKTMIAVMNGDTSLHPQIANQLMTHVAKEEKPCSSFHDLTPRERVILKHIT